MSRTTASRIHKGNKNVRMYRARNKGMHILLSNSQAGIGRTVKQEQEEISRNQVQTFIPGSVIARTSSFSHLRVFREWRCLMANIFHFLTARVGRIMNINCRLCYSNGVISSNTFCEIWQKIMKESINTKSDMYNCLLYLYCTVTK